jgi:exopolysaccharide biosynthesis polyprenyl glycosylphosphotransferase
MRLLLLILGDIFILYLGLFITLFLRYGANFYNIFVNLHFLPFSIIFILWIAVFYIAGLYDFRRLRNNLEFLKTLTLTIFVEAVLAITFFYLIPAFGITPKTNLFIFIVVFAVIEIIWRRTWNRLTASLGPVQNLLFAGEEDNPSFRELADFIFQNPQLGYKISAQLFNSALFSSLNNIEKWRGFIKEKKVDLIIVPLHFKKESRFAKTFYQLLTLGAEIRDLPYFYETVFRKVPLKEIDEGWFLEKITGGHKFYDELKRAMEILAALALEIILLPFEILIALVIKFSSAGPVIYKQKRIGRGGKEFILYKFRTMNVDAEKNGAQWKINGAADPRLTPFGRLLVASHLDELPQLLNIIKGELSFVGPRPERPEFVEVLAQKIPYYDIRHLIKPGVSGWAQINYRYGASIEDSYEKLQYDIYYIKNRSLILDAAIILKTIKSFFVNQP